MPDRLRPVAVGDFVCAVCSPRDSLPAAGRCGRRIGLPLKYADVAPLPVFLQRRDDCDEILIVRDGAITDTSYSNVAFFRRTEIRYAGYFPAQRHAEAVLARYGSFNRMPHYAFRPGRFRAGRAHQCHVGNRGRPRRSDRTDSGIITEGKWHNRRVADLRFLSIKSGLWRDSAVCQLCRS